MTMNHNKKLCAALVMLTVLMTGCEDKDYFNQASYDSLVKGTFPIENVDPTHDWKTVGRTNVQVSVPQNTNEYYKVRVYDKSPIGRSSHLTLLGEGSVKGGQITTVPVSYPLATSVIYVTLYDSRGYMTVYPQGVDNGGTVKLQMGSAQTASSQSRKVTRAIAPDHNFSADIPAKPTTTGMDDANFLKAVPNGVKSYQERCQELGNEYWTPKEFTGGSTYIDANHTGEVKIYKGDGDNKLYVRGNCDFTNRSFYLGESFDVYLLEGAHLTIPSGFSGNTKVYIANNAKLTVNSSISTGNVSYYSKGGQIEVKGSLVINGSNELFMEGGSLKVTGEKLQLQPANLYAHNTNIEIIGLVDVNLGWANNSAVQGLFYQEGGSFTCGSYLVCNSGKFYTDINTQFTSIEANGTGVIVNKAGTMTSTSTIRVTNGQSVLINDGTLVGSYLGTEGSSHVQNNGTATINGETLVNSNDNAGVNNGEYHTTNFTYAAGSKGVINNCHLVVDELFKIYLGDVWPQDRSYTITQGFRMDAGASVDTKNFMATGPMFINMGAGSLFKVRETAYMDITKDVYGIYGPEEGDYAVFQAKDIVRGVTGQNGDQTVNENQGFVANYFGHLYVACDSHFNFGYSDKSAEQQAAGEVGNQPYYRLDAASGARMTSYNGADVHVTDNGCGSAYSGEPDGDDDEESEPLCYRFCFEDNFPQPGDYDFNDCVLTVTPQRTETGVRLTVSVDAAGGYKQVAACLRLINVGSDYVNVTLGSDILPSAIDFPNAFLGNGSNWILNEVQSDGQPVVGTDLVLVLFNDIHYALNPTALTATGQPVRQFYNTLADRDNERGTTVEPATVVYDIACNNNLADVLMNADNIDAFIVENHNGMLWEVHTYQYKTDQVLYPIANSVKLLPYSNDPYPWAIMVPGREFKYPIEWTPVGSNKNLSTEPAYTTYGHSFSEWAENHSQATDWYNYPTPGLVYE